MSIVFVLSIFFSRILFANLADFFIFPFLPFPLFFLFYIYFMFLIISWILFYLLLWRQDFRIQSCIFGCSYIWSKYIWSLRLVLFRLTLYCLNSFLVLNKTLLVFDLFLNDLVYQSIFLVLNVLKILFKSIHILKALNIIVKISNFALTIVVEIYLIV